MLSLMISIEKLLKSFWIVLKEEKTRGLIFLIFVTLLSGTIFYSTVEKFSLLNALYLSFMTLTTIGYGDLYPTTDIGKIFTMIYATVGLGLMAMFISIIAKAYISTKKRK